LAAALAAKKDGDTRTVNIKELQEALIAQNAYLDYQIR
jgi:hypothetical protein